MAQYLVGRLSLPTCVPRRSLGTRNLPNLQDTSTLSITVTNYQHIYESIVADPRYLANLDWGESRPGHPEGTVRAHIAEIESNLERLKDRLSEADCWKLKILVHTHDSFKREADRGVPIAHLRSHASLARAFLAEFCSDDDLLAMIQYHDEPFALWRQVAAKGNFDSDRLSALIRNVKDWNLFLAFAIIDGCTAGKDREPLRWLFAVVEGRVVSKFAVMDLL